ncbi:MAG: hypothetical protein JW785_03530 [Acidimicrobiia bacterium]|nr:hypothetical protein [Acidimicrobiia bacterium]
MDETAAAACIDLYWIPLGAGGNGYVRLNGRLYETVKARFEGRRPLALYHTALVVEVPDGRFVIECAWPSPDDDVAGRGVVLEGPVWGRRLARIRPFRYEVRRWRDGIIPDLAHAVGGPQAVGRDPGQAERLLELVPAVPALVWGRDERGTGEMWNSNSVISWLLASAGAPVRGLHPPEGGRAPGWQAGVAVAAAGHQG